MREGSCLGAYFTVNNDIPKIAPIRFWSLEDVWRFLNAERDFKVEPLRMLYLFNGNLGVRYGCGQCTLVKRQWGNYLKDHYLYVEAVRVMYRAVSDMKELRIPKEGGYSRLGPLNALGRSIIFNAVKIAEELAGSKVFYGLDVEVRHRDRKLTLRDLFYYEDPQVTDNIISGLDPTERRVPILRLRVLKSNIGWQKAIRKLEANIVKKNVEEIVKKKLLEIIKDLR
jgi:DNA sulfur modification protein DndC